MVFISTFDDYPFEIRCSCGGAWVRKTWGTSDKGFWYNCVEKRDVVVYACDSMQKYYGKGVRHRPVHWQVRCQDRDCACEKPVVLHGEDIHRLPGFMEFNNRNSEFYQENRYNHHAYICPRCAENARREAEERWWRIDHYKLVASCLPRRPALRFQDIIPEHRQTFKKSVKGRRGSRQANDAFYSHVVYRDNLHEKRIQELENALEELKRKHPQDQYIQSMRYEFFWEPADDGLSTHSLRVEFPTKDYSLTFTV